MKDALKVLGIFLMMLGFIPAWAQPVPDSSGPDTGDALLVGTIGMPSNLIPMLASDSASHDISSLVFSGLVKYDTDLSLTGDLAESWEVSDDGLTITFFLRKDVLWQDGHPFTAEDVLFGFKTITDPKTPTAYAGDFLQVKNAEIIDPYTFRVTYKEPFAPALGSWGNMIVLPKHLMQGQNITQTPFSRKPVGLGPFVFNKWIPGEKIVLSANPRYFKGRPFLDHYVYRYIPDPATQFLELQSGSIDMMGLTPMQYTRQTDNDYFKSQFAKYKYPTFSYTYMAFNFLDPRFEDRRVRQAIAHAIDKQEIVDGVLLGLGKPSTGPYVPDTWPYNPDVKRYPYDPETSKKLLRDAGWTDSNGDGILDREGRPFEFTILTNMGNSLRLKAATIIQWRLEMIGIKVEIRVLEWATFLNEFVDKKRFQALILGWGIGLDPDQYDIWHSSKTGTKEFNFISYKNHEVDRLLETGRRTFNLDERKEAYSQFQRILADDIPYIFLYVAYATPIIHSRFKNIRPTPIGLRYNIERWHVPRSLQKYTLMP